MCLRISTYIYQYLQPVGGGRHLSNIFCMHHVILNCMILKAELRQLAQKYILLHLKYFMSREFSITIAKYNKFFKILCFDQNYISFRVINFY